MEKIKKAIGIVALATFLVMAADFTCLICWVYSDQQPADGFYMGAISASVLRHFYADEGFNGRNYINYNQFDPETGEQIKDESK